MSETLGDLGVLAGGRTIADLTSISSPEDVRKKGGIGWDEFMRIYHQMRTVVREECDEETARRIGEAWREIPLWGDRAARVPVRVSSKVTTEDE